MTIIIRNIFFLALFIFFFSCKNESRKANLEEFEKKIIADSLLEKFTNKPEEFEFNMDKDQTIKIASGIEIKIFNKSLIKNPGKIYQGKVKLSLKMINKIDEFLKEYIASESDKGELMRTQGYLRLDLRDSLGESLFIDQLHPLRLVIDKTHELSSYHCYSYDTVRYGWGIPQDFSKINLKDTGLPPFFWSNSLDEKTDTAKNYNLLGHKVTGSVFLSFYVTLRYADTWNGINRLWEEPYIQPAYFQCKLSNSPMELKNIKMALILKEDHCFLTGKSSRKNIFYLDKSSDGIKKLPIGHEAYLILYGFENNKAYYFQKKITISKHNVVEAQMAQITIDELEQKIKNL